MSNRYLISFPRSGNSWIRHFFEYYTGAYSVSVYTKGDHDAPLLHKIIEGERPCLIKSHFFYDIKDIKDTDMILYLLRDFKDVLFSHCDVPENPSDEFFYKYLIMIEKKWIPLYVKNLIEFRKQKCSKLLLYYEDLISDFKIETKKAISFFKFPINDKKIEEYMGNNNSNLAQIRKWYGKPIIDTNFVGRHKIIYPDFVIKKINSLFECKYSDICNTFLYRYLE